MLQTPEAATAYFREAGAACLIARSSRLDELDDAAGSPLVRALERRVGSKSLALVCRPGEAQAENTGSQVVTDL